MQDKGDEEREQRMIREQIRRARKEAGVNEEDDAEDTAEDRELKRQEGERIKLSFGAKPAAAQPNKDSSEPLSKPPEARAEAATDAKTTESTAAPPDALAAATDKPTSGGPVSLKMTAAKPQTKNVFAAAKKNALAGAPRKKSAFEQPKKVSEAERIMKEEMEKKRARGSSGFGGPSNKRQRM